MRFPVTQFSRGFKTWPWTALGTAALMFALSFPIPVQAMKTVSEKTLSTFKWPESVAYDAQNTVLYVSEFVSGLKPTEKDGEGRISKVSLEGNVLEEHFLPAPGVKINKPKGLWVAGNRLWTTDIDGVWVFDLKTKKGRKVMLPGVQFANDPTVVGETLFVSDNRGDQLFSVSPADFLEAKDEPKVTLVFTGKSVNPNGIYPAKDGSLLMVGFKSDKEARAIFSMAPGKEPKAISKDIGMLDGVYELPNGDLLASDWVSGSLFSINAKGEMTTLAKNFKGPADFAVYAISGGLMVVVPDLAKSEIRWVQLAN
ncbi:MAG: hypothetical protein OEW39_06795 [Deltaproteobacteria bacterium]|nr:hypothetical protein [Deltaproteobacteria bacterium]